MKFETWFVQQHGKRPSKKPSFELRAEFSKLEVKLWEARKLVLDCERWDAQYQSARDTWNISDGYKERIK